MGIVDTFTRLLGVRPTRNGTDFYDLAERERRVPDAEMSVAKVVLGGGDPIAEQALRQLRETSGVYRLRTEDGRYELRIVTRDDLAIRDAPRGGWTSEPIPIETTAGRDMELRVGIVEAGIVGMTGRTTDGTRWPKAWRISAAGLDRIRAGSPWVRLPKPAEREVDRIRAAETIGAWLEEPGLQGVRGSLRAGPLASEHDLAAFEERESFQLPDAYRALLRTADGIGIGPLDILGTTDAYRLDVPGPPRLVIVAPDEAGAYVLRESGAVEWMDIDGDAAGGAVRAADMRTWVRQLVREGVDPAD